MTTATTDQTARQYLVSQGLAKPDATRGRFSREGQAALDAARADGVVFADDVKAVKVVKQVVNSPAPSPVSLAKPPVAQSNDVDPKAVRSWAKQVGLTVGDRGRIHGDVIAAYVTANGITGRPTVARGVVAPKPTPALMPLRVEKVAYGLIRRGANDPRFLSEPLLAISECGKCARPIQFCPCASGPSLPKFVGGGVASLTRL